MIIEAKDLTFKYQDKLIFDNLNLQIEENKWYSLIGKNGCGKSTLAKMIVGLIPSNIIVDGKRVIENIRETRKIVGLLMANPNDNLVCETVREELSFPLQNIELSSNEINNRIKNISKILDLKLSKNITELTTYEKQLLSLSSILVMEPKVLILDEAFTYLDDYSKNKILNILKQLNITIINITHNMEDTLYSDNIIIIEDGKVRINDLKEVVYKEEKDLPFVVDLSRKLIYYDLLKEIKYNYKDLVDEVWKSN